jgi:hypothetical protein
MKRVFVSIVLAIAMMQSSSMNAFADENNCDVGSLPPTFDYLNPPAEPTKSIPGSISLGKLTARVETADFGSFSLSKELKDPNSITTYFYFYSNDGGKNWFCERSYATIATVELTPNKDYLAIAVASAQGGKGLSSITSFSTKKKNVQLCAPADSKFNAAFDSNSKRFSLEVKTSSQLDFNQTLIKYKIEVSTDNWKTKGIYRDLLSLNYSMYVKPIKENVVHQYRLLPQMDDPMLVSLKGQLVDKYVSTGCKLLSTSASPIDTRSDCEKNPGLEKCEITFTPGENAGTETLDSMTASPSPVASKTTIACIKGKLTKKVTGMKPICPTGYKKK